MHNHLQLKIFNNSDFKEQIRGIEIDGTPYVVGIDVAKSLAYKDPFGAIKKHVDSEDKLNCQISSAGQKRTVTVINESGVWTLALRSKLPNAKKFRRWVTSEVLPSIRKTGQYVANREPDNDGKFLLWYEVRRLGKDVRRELTDAIKQHNIYFDLIGTKYDSIMYGKYTNLVYKLIKVPKGMRDKLDGLTLTNIANLELAASDEIIKGLLLNLNQKQIFCNVSKRLITYAQTCLLQNRIDRQLAALIPPKA